MAGFYKKCFLFLRPKILRLFKEYSIPQWMLFFLDCLSVVLTFFLAYLLFHNFHFNDILLKDALIHTLIALGIYAVFFIAFRSFSGLIRHTTLTDLTLAFGATSSAVIMFLIFALLSRILNLGGTLTVPFSIIMIHYGLITIALFSSRMSIKLLFHFAGSTPVNSKKVLIYGTGELGFIIKSIIMIDPRNEIDVAGFIDDNKKLQGKKINGIPIYSPDVLNEEFIKKNQLKILILTISTLSPSRRSEIARKTLDLGIEVLKISERGKWLNGNLEIKDLQRISLEDLLGREPNMLNLKRIEKGIKGKTIMITGAAGSVGSEIVRQITRFAPGRVILVDQAETPMFQIENEFSAKYDNNILRYVLADITNSVKMESIFIEHSPEIIFHSAAYKHVSLAQKNPHEAFMVNIGGTKTLIELSIRYSISKFVYISTDKCFYPTGVMVATKRISEMLLQEKQKQQNLNTQFIVTRFGNVLGSNGSVIPTFRDQINNGGPVTVTHPEISRVFMTIPDACELILEATFMGRDELIYDFDMGEQVKITDLAHKMIRLSGFEPGQDIDIKYTGLRPGEELFDDKPASNMCVIPTDNPRIRIIKPDDVNPQLSSSIDMMLQRLYEMSTMEVIDNMQDMINYPNSRIN